MNTLLNLENFPCYEDDDLKHLKPNRPKIPPKPNRIAGTLVDWYDIANNHESDEKKEKKKKSFW